MTSTDDHHFADRTLLGVRLKEWRKTGDLKIEAAARALGVSTSTWGHWETGHTFPSGEMLLDISRLLDLPLQRFFCPHACPFAAEDSVPSAGIPNACHLQDCPAGTSGPA